MEHLQTAPNGAQTMVTADVRESVRILLLSIVNPDIERNGAATVTRGLLKVLRSPTLQANVVFVPVRTAPRKWHRVTQAFSVLSSLVSQLPSKATFLKSSEFREDVEARLRREVYDLVVLNGSDLLWISDSIPASIPQIVIMHNIENQLFRCQIQNLGWLYRPLQGLLLRDCQRLEEFEWNGVRWAGSAIFLSGEEAAYAHGRCPDLRSAVVPPLFDYAPAVCRRKEPGAVLEIGCVGNFRWWPNELGVRWFVDRVLANVRVPIQLHLFGQRAYRAWTDPRVIEHGVVEDTEEIWAKCDFLICPTVSDGGVSVKLAEAAYNGMPVLATKQAARGLGLEEDPALLLLDEPREWVDLLNSPAARDLAEQRVSGKNARRFATDTHRAALHQFVTAVLDRGGSKESLKHA